MKMQQVSFSELGSKLYFFFVCFHYPRVPLVALEVGHTAPSLLLMMKRDK